MSRAASQARYREWLEDHVRARFNFGAEIAAFASRVTGGVLNDTPPVTHWGAMAPTVRVLERVRERFGPTTLTSAYRSPAYNRAVGGAAASQHVANSALDFRCREGTPQDWMTFLRDLRTQGVFSGGVGLYVRSGFVHVDTRGVAVDWQG